MKGGHRAAFTVNDLHRHACSLRIDVAPDDRRTLSSKRERSCTTNASARSSDEADLLCESQWHFVLSDPASFRLSGGALQFQNRNRSNAGSVLRVVGESGES